MTRTHLDPSLSIAAVAATVMITASLPALARGHGSHAAAATAGGSADHARIAGHEQSHGVAAEQQEHSSAFVQTIRDATRRFQDVTVAEAEGYALMFGCVSGPDSGAMGLHYVNLALVGDGMLDPSRPEIVIYEPTASGKLRLIGADFLVFADAWHAGNVDTPQLGGQLLHLFESPNRFGLPAFYTLHVWAWKNNPTGMFSNWHAKVSCEDFSGA